MNINGFYLYCLSSVILFCGSLLIVPALYVDQSPNAKGMYTYEDTSTKLSIEHGLYPSEYLG